MAVILIEWLHNLKGTMWPPIQINVQPYNIMKGTSKLNICVLGHLYVHRTPK